MTAPETVLDAGLAYLLDRVRGVELRVRRAVEGARADDPEPDDPFRGLYLSEEAVARLLAARRAPLGPDAVEESWLAEVEQAADQAERDGATIRLRQLARAAGLGPLDVELLLVALTPELDSRFEQLYGYLNNDVTRRRATVGMALRLCGVPEADAAGRARLRVDAPLGHAGLLVLGDLDRPLLGRSLLVPDRVVAHLLGDDQPDPALAGVLVGVPDHLHLAGGDTLAGALRHGVRLAYLRERLGGTAQVVAVAALAAAGAGSLSVDVARLLAEPDPDGTALALVREARLTRAGLVVGPVEPPGSGGGDAPGGPTGSPTAVAVLRRLTRSGVPVILTGTGTWDPRWSDELPLQLDVEIPTRASREAVWRSELAGRLADGVDPADTTSQFLLGSVQIARAARAATQQAALNGGAVEAEHLRYGARAQNAAGLERLARRIEPAVTWDDLVLPVGATNQLHELAARARNRDRVLGEWRMRPGGGRGRGVTALFAGDSGTGKTMSAEVVAGELGLDMYTVNLATVVDKYVGETEKNLERIFSEAAGVNGVLLFDEADAIFGKRSEVRDAHDRYANIESAYLLQRMETFDGLAVLATNLRANLDEAFTRRLDVVVDFPVPDEPLRRSLWDRCLGPGVPREDALDLDFLAGSFELAGGNIRAAAVTAAYLAAADGRPVGTTDLVAGVVREYRKLGRLCLEREFGRYLHLAAS
ncbi:MAG: ATP-binding protein [Mycobacteriales bacterium]